MLPKLIAVAITSGLAVKAWDQYRTSHKPKALPEDITNLVGRPEAVEPSSPGKGQGKTAAAKRREGPAA